MSNSVIIGAIIISILIVFYCMMKVLGTPKQNRDERIKMLETEIKSFGAKIISATKSKKIDCPYSSELEDDGSIYVPYKIKYLLEGEEKEGWAILKIEQSFINRMGTSEKKIIWKL
ncbi:hypothetical protein [Sporosalibacterium faouarense]|uniref:hypothetical protein n=1 Tax=Sporosalibacterium faouarense TaxID=516123 RepID=UPI00192A7BCB|nr:hypothetical protein [Sporosalibacterium faouarense]